MSQTILVELMERYMQDIIYEKNMYNKILENKTTSAIEKSIAKNEIKKIRLMERIFSAETSGDTRQIPKIVKKIESIRHNREITARHVR